MAAFLIDKVGDGGPFWHRDTGLSCDSSGKSTFLLLLLVLCLFVTHIQAPFQGGNGVWQNFHLQPFSSGLLSFQIPSLLQTLSDYSDVYTGVIQSWLALGLGRNQLPASAWSPTQVFTNWESLLGRNRSPFSMIYSYKLKRDGLQWVTGLLSKPHLVPWSQSGRREKWRLYWILFDYVIKRPIQGMLMFQSPKSGSLSGILK